MTNQSYDSLHRIMIGHFRDGNMPAYRVLADRLTQMNDEYVARALTAPRDPRPHFKCLSEQVGARSEVTTASAD